MRGPQGARTRWRAGRSVPPPPAPTGIGRGRKITRTCPPFAGWKAGRTPTLHTTRYQGNGKINKGGGAHTPAERPPTSVLLTSIGI